MKKICLALSFILTWGFLKIKAQNVGIGEPFPVSMKLEVKSPDSATFMLHNATASGSNVKTGMYFKTGNNYSGAINTIGNPAGPTFRMGFFTYGSSLPSGLLERMSILDGGDVGIGTIAPNAQLHVVSTDSANAIFENTQALAVDVKTEAGFRTGGYYTGAVKTIGVAGGTARLGIFTNTSILPSGLQERISVKNNGFVGINTINPTEQLSVQTVTNSIGITHTDGTIKIGTFVGGAGVGGYFGTVSNHPLYFMTNNGSAQVTLLQNGNMGIGTTSPGATLTVARGSGTNGTAQFFGTVNSSHFNYGTTEETYIRGGKANSEVIINDVSTGNIRLAEGGGFVGVNTPTPTGLLDINKGSIGAPAVRIEGTTYTSFLLGGTNEDIQFDAGKSAGGIFLNSNATGNVAMVFGGGKVGIGSVNPSEKLTVVTNTGNFGLLHTDGVVSVGSYINDAFGGSFGTKSNHPLNFFTNNGGYQATLLQNGNFGIGTLTPAAKLQVAGTTNTQGLVVSNGAAANRVMVSTDAAGTAAWQGPVWFNVQLQQETGSSGVIRFVSSGAQGTTSTLDFTNNLFTVPVSGPYHFDIEVQPALNPYDAVEVELQVVSGATVVSRLSRASFNEGYEDGSFHSGRPDRLFMSVTKLLSAGQTVRIAYNTSNNNTLQADPTTSGAISQFSGYLVR